METKPLKQKLHSWTLAGFSLRPTSATHLHSQYNENELIHFSYSTYNDGNFQYYVHTDLLDAVDTNLLVDCIEKGHPFQLPSISNHNSFQIIRGFLYGQVIPLVDVELQDILDVLFFSNRWKMNDLYYGLWLFIVEARFLINMRDVMDVVKVVDRLHVPLEVQNYLWDRVGFYYEAGITDKFCQLEQVEALDDNYSTKQELTCGVKVIDSSELEAKFQNTTSVSKPASPPSATPTFSNANHDSLCLDAVFLPRLPTIWKYAIKYSKTKAFMQSILCYATRDHRKELIQITLKHLEPHIDNDETVLDLISMLKPDVQVVEEMIESWKCLIWITANGMRLLAKALLSSQMVREEARYHWDVSLNEDKAFEREFFISPNFYSQSTKSEPSMEQLIADMNNLKVREGKTGKGAIKLEKLYETSIRFNICSDGTNDEAISFSICWEAGALLRHVYHMTKVHVDMSILQGMCTCETNEWMNDGRHARCLSQSHARLPVTEKGRVQVRLDEHTSNRLRKMHVDEQCCLTISVIARLE